MKFIKKKAVASGKTAFFVIDPWIDQLCTPHSICLNGLFKNHVMQNFGTLTYSNPLIRT